MVDGNQPVAVVGVGCRFAGGADSADAYWDLLVNGGDGVSEVPAERWAGYADLGPDYAAALRRATRWAAVLDDIEGFDAEFFGVTPREAELMDPQQRILLETAWDALEHAGIPPRELAGGDTGVFVGVGSDDYGRRLLEDLPNIEAWTGIGAAMCAVANRISYALDLRGPSLAVDTACSSSLVSLHLACQSLRAGESPIALAAGVNLIVSPGLTLTLDAAGATAPDGRSKSFDSSANGYGRGEGAGVLVLKLLADAERDGDRVLAVIRGSAVNQDGRTNGIMAPSGEAQQYVLERALRHAGVDPSSVSYIEAHGTGTRLGDPLEASALSAVYGAGRPKGRPCLIGSVKSNIGHLEAAAGVAGLIKAVLALSREEIPPSLNYTTGNPEIDWDGGGLRVVTRRTPWPRREQPRRAGVSGFGYGGTIAHVVLEEAPAAAPAAADPADGAPARLRSVPGGDGAPGLYPVSAASEKALREYAGRLAGWLTGRGARTPLPAVGRTLALRRSPLAHRAAVTAAGREELAAKLAALAAGDADRSVVVGRVPSETGAGLVWVFSGHGSQWAGMGRDLLAREPVFAEVIDTIDPIFQEEVGFSPRRVLTDGDLVDVDKIQTMIFAMQTGLAALWRAAGVTPDAVIGHSVGEIAAAVTAGALTLEAGARLICRRSALLRRVAGRGAMAMATLPFEEAEQRLRGRSDVVAAIASSPSSTVVSGDAAAVEELVAGWQAAGVVVRRVASDVAFHSPHMDPLLDELSAAAADLSPGRPVLPMYSTVLDDPRAMGVADGSYWAANLRRPVRLASAVRAAADDGYRAFLEISAHPVVAHSIGETLGDDEAGEYFVGSTLRRDKPEPEQFLSAVGAAHAHGVEVGWDALQPSGGLAELPPLAWQRRPHWRAALPGGEGGGLRHDPGSHALLGPPVPVAGRSLRLWRTLLDDSCRPYPGSHTVNGVEIVPAAVLLATFLGAAPESGGALDEVDLLVPLTVAERREVQVLHDDGGLRLASRVHEDGGDRLWLTHAAAAAPTGDVSDVSGALPEPSGAEAADPGLVARHLASVGVPTMGFGWEIEELTRHGSGLRAVVRPERDPDAADTWAPLLDAALSIAPCAPEGEAVLRMVAGVREVRLPAAPPPVAVIDVTVHAPDGDTGDAVLDVLIAEPDGRVAGRLTGVRYAVLDREPGTAASPRRLVHEVAWRPLELPAAEGDDAAAADTDTAPRTAVIVGPDPRNSYPLGERLAALGVPNRTVATPDDLDGLDGLTADTDVIVLPPPPEGPVVAAATGAAWLLTRTAQRLAALTGDRPKLWSLTIGVKESRAERHVAQSSLWGLGRIVAGEHPEFWGGTVDLPPEHPDDAAETLVALLRAAPREDVIAVRDGVAHAARLALPEAPAADAPETGLDADDAAPAAQAGPPEPVPVRCHADGTYLITGGLGVLGLEIARWLAERGARRIVLAGRRALPPRSTWDAPADAETRRRIDGVRALEAAGVTVRAVALDVSDAASAAAALDPDALGLPPIRGVVHAAGVLDNRMTTGVDEESLHTIMRPKAAGAWVLHELFPPGELDFFVLFSSCGQLLGLPGQAGYAAANAFLDALAEHRRAGGHTDTLSLGWTSWRGLGMAVNRVVDLELAARGTAVISAPEAFASWDLAAGLGAAHLAVLRVTALEPGMERPPILAELDVPADAAAAGDAADGAARFAGLSPEELRDKLVEEVREQVAGEMRLPAAGLDPRRSLAEQGLDSVMTLVIRRRLEKLFGHALPATLLWHQPTVTAIADHLAGLLGEDADTEAGSADAGPGDAEPVKAGV